MIVLKYCNPLDEIESIEFNNLRDALLHSMNVFFATGEDCEFYYKSIRIYDKCDCSIDWNINYLQQQMDEIDKLENELNT